MKNLFFFFILLVSISSCTPEQQEQIQEDFVIKAMTDGQWRVSNFTQGSVDMSAGFTPYKFQFKNTLTVDAILISNNSVEKSGTWAANSAALTITSNFTNANATLTLLNGTWTITRNSITFVEARQTVGAEVWLLRLDKL